MRVFISSVIRGMEPHRAAVSDAVESLGYAVIRSEEFGPSTDTPRRACLQAARTADLTIVLLGATYGQPQSSGLSATHEEFREACDHGTVAVLVQSDTVPKPRQREFLREAQDWATGRLTDTFSGPDDLRSKVTRLLHQHALLQQSGPPEPSELLERARAWLPRHRHHSSPRLHVIVTGGPRQELIPPSKLDDQRFSGPIIQQALFGTEPVFTPGLGTRTVLERGHLRLEQDGAKIVLAEDGTVVVSAPAIRRDREIPMALPALIEDDIRGAIAAALGFIGWFLDEMDSLRRLSHIVVLGAIEGGSVHGWRTRAEHAANPHSMTMSMHQRDLVVVPEEPVVRPRAHLTANRDQLVEDLLARLRREVRTPPAGTIL